MILGGADAHPVTGAVSFANPAALDFHLTPGAAAIDRGVTLATDVARDFDGISRPQGPAYDLGAFEYVAGGGIGGGGAVVLGLEAESAALVRLLRAQDVLEGDARGGGLRGHGSHAIGCRARHAEGRGKRHQGAGARQGHRPRHSTQRIRHGRARRAGDVQLRSSASSTCLEAAFSLPAQLDAKQTYKDRTN